MEALETVNTMQRYADWSVLANRAQYGLDLFIRSHKLEDQSASYLRDAKFLCKQLQEGIEAKDRPITTSQLGSVDAVQPLIRRATIDEITAAKLRAIDELLDKILGGRVDASLPISFDDAIDIFAKIAASYRDTVQSHLDSLRATESPSSRSPG